MPLVFSNADAEMPPEKGAPTSRKIADFIGLVNSVLCICMMYGFLNLCNESLDLERQFRLPAVENMYIVH